MKTCLCDNKAKTEEIIYMQHYILSLLMLLSFVFLPASLQLFHVAYVLIKFANSPRPDLWVLERSTDSGQTYQPWQYFACEYKTKSELMSINQSIKLHVFVHIRILWTTLEAIKSILLHAIHGFAVEQFNKMKPGDVCKLRGKSRRKTKLKNTRFLLFSRSLC